MAWNTRVVSWPGNRSDASSFFRVRSFQIFEGEHDRVLSMRERQTVAEPLESEGLIHDGGGGEGRGRVPPFPLVGDSSGRNPVVCECTQGTVEELSITANERIANEVLEEVIKDSSDYTDGDGRGEREGGQIPGTYGKK